MKRCLDKRNAKLTRAVKRNINSIARLEQEFLRQRSAVACLSDWITDVIGSPIFIVGHLVCLTAWIVLNTVAIPGVPQSHVDLQVNLLAEQEATKMLQLLHVICNRLGLRKVVQDQRLKEMLTETHILAMAQELEKAREP